MTLITRKRSFRNRNYFYDFCGSKNHFGDFYNGRFGGFYNGRFGGFCNDRFGGFCDFLLQLLFLH
ncbi:hypothetical protein GN156_00235 [bacterium LRH843]|nr:hypothetical protein [bacterium LRH843]